MVKEYRVLVEETYVAVWIVQAESEDDARANYSLGEMVDNDELVEAHVSEVMEL